MTDLFPILVGLLTAMIIGAAATLSGHANGTRRWGLGGAGVGLALGSAIGIAIWAGHEGIYSPWRDGPVACLWVALAGAGLLILRAPTGRAMSLMGGAALGAVVLALHPMVGPGRYYSEWADAWPLLVAGLLWAAATPFAEAGMNRHRAAAGGLLAWTALSLTALCLVLAHSTKLGQYTGIMSAAAAGVALLGWCRPASASGLGAALHLLLGTSALLGTVYADLPRSAGLLLAAGALTPWLAALRPWRDRPVLRVMITMIAIVMLGGGAIAVTVLCLARPATASATPYDYGY